MPKRVQRSRAKGWRMPEGAVYVGRPTEWGNPFKAGAAIGYAFEQSAVDLFREWIDQRPKVQQAAREKLRGKDLVCWCRIDQPCHADVLLEIANT